MESKERDYALKCNIKNMYGHMFMAGDLTASEDLNFGVRMLLKGAVSFVENAKF